MTNGLSVGWRLMFALGLLSILYATWSLIYLTSLPFSFEEAFGVSMEEVDTFNHGISKWIDLQVHLKTVFLSFIVSIGVLICFVSYYGYRRGEKWSWFALLIFPVFPLAAGILSFGKGFLLGEIYGVSSIDIPLKLAVGALIPLYILGLSLPFSSVVRGNREGKERVTRRSGQLS